MRLGTRLRLALKILFGRNVELVHYEDGHAVATAEETLRRILAERDQLAPALFIGYWTVEPNWAVHIPCWFEGSVRTAGLAVVRQAIRQTVAVIRWD